MLQGRSVGSGSTQCPAPLGGTYNVVTKTLTRLTFTSSDGTEFELHDKQTDGQPQSKTCATSATQFNRGKVFITSDGSSATFFSDTDIKDTAHFAGGSGDAVSKHAGLLLLRDGTRYRFDNGTVTWIRDSNGNVISFDYDTNKRVNSILDSMGRHVTVAYDQAEGGQYGTCDRIVFNGFGAAERVLRVCKTNLGSAMRSTRPGDVTTLQTYKALFPELNGSNTTNYDTTVVGSVWLPDGQRRYQLSYNQYGELARVELPTGGAVEYDYTGGYVNGNADGVVGTGASNKAHIYRRVVERRLYPVASDLNTFENRTTYSRPEGFNGGSSTNAGFVVVERFDSAGARRTYEKHYFNGSANGSFGGFATYYNSWEVGREYKTEVFDASGTTPLTRVEREWRQRATPAWWNTNYGPEPANDPRLVTTTTTVEPNGANLVSKTTAIDPSDATAQTVGFDHFNNETDTWVYDYGAGAPPQFAVRHTHTDYETTADYVNADPDPLLGPSLRSLPRGQLVYSVDPATGAETILAKSEARYDEAAYAPLTYSVTVPGWSDPGTAARGNLTSARNFINAAVSANPAQACPAGVCVETHAQYDQLGNLRVSWDSNNNQSKVFYDDAFCNDHGVRCDGDYTPNTFALPTRAETPPPGSTSFGSTSPLVTTSVYDFHTGLVYSSTDPNGQTTTRFYEDANGNLDPLNRLKAVVRPDGSRTDFNYGDTVGNLYVQTLTDLDAERRTYITEFFDGLGRVYRKAAYENSVTAQPWLNVDTAYDALGKVSRVSMPYRSAGGGTPLTTAQWSNFKRTESTYDVLGRVLTVTTQPDGATTRSDYSGDRVLVKDQAGKERVTRSDALGRLTEVWEVTPAESGAEASTVAIDAFTGHPEAAYGYLTSYKYDALGNLRMSEQDGQHLGQAVTQRRFFAYDSLGRLVRAKSTEQGSFTADPPTGDFPALADSSSGVSNSQWSIGYIYDANGNLTKRRDARGTTTTYAYDALNRNTTVSYALVGGTAASPDISHYYDNPASGANGIGQLWKSESFQTARTTVDLYDATGRPKKQTQQFWVAAAWGQPYVVQQTYNKGGGVTSKNYPSGHVVNYNYDAAGRLGDNGAGAAFSGNLGDEVTRTYASEIRYHESGGMEQERFGTDTPVYNKHLYNSRGQLAEIRVSTYSITTPGQEANWNRGAIINNYSASGWGASGGGSDNNGNLRRQDVFISNIEGAGYDQGGNVGVNTQTFLYDSLNRLQSVGDSATTLTQTYKYDRWGNRTIDADATAVAPEPQFSVDASTNRLGVPAGQGGVMTYDAAGNLTNDTYQGVGTRAYDAENRMTSAQTGGQQGAAYTYDADGRRIKRNDGTSEVWQVYGIGGELLAEYAAGAAAYSPRKEYGYRGGELLVTAEASAGGWGPTPVIHDNPLVARQTVVQSRHVTELRDAIDALRSHKGLAPYSWLTDASAGAFITADPISEMRTALDQALGAPSGGYAPGLAQHQPVLAVHIQELRDRVLGAWQAGGSESDIRWLVTDQLGTPRMVLDKTGSLSGVTRHDYLPFGEVTPGDTNWRKSDRGFAGDAVRQKFTGKERDNETGLDFFGARYYGSTQGRFTSTDPLFIEAKRLAYPQSWNLYAYTRNNPLKYTDPDGMEVKINCGASDSKNFQQCVDQTTTDLNNRRGSQFQVEIKDGKLGVVGQVDVSKLSKSEAELYKAITDQKNVTELIMQMPGIASQSIMFDQYNGPGSNTVDRADLNQLNKADKSLAGEAIAHAAIEGYVGVAEGLSTYQDAHSRANEFFGNVKVGPIEALPAGAATATSGRTVYDFGRVGLKATVEKVFITPQPAESLSTNWERIMGNLRVITPNQPPKPNQEKKP